MSNRREFLSWTAHGLGGAALVSLLVRDNKLAKAQGRPSLGFCEFVVAHQQRHERGPAEAMSRPRKKLSAIGHR